MNHFDTWKIKALFPFLQLQVLFIANASIIYFSAEAFHFSG